MSTIKSILAPVDFSDSSVRAARAAVAWAERFSGEVCLLHVVPDALHDRAYHELAEFSLPTLVQDWTRGTRDALEALGERLATSPGRVRTLVRLGQPATEIVTCAAEQQTDLIIMASTGHSPVGRLLLGSVAEQVVRQAVCPVLTIPGEVDVTRWSENREGLLRSMTLRTIVVLTDLSDASSDAVTYAHDLAAELHGVLHVLHVVAPVQDLQLASVPPPMQRSEELRWRAERALMRVAARFEDAHPRRRGTPGD
jgi:universal stress protein A